MDKSGLNEHKYSGSIISASILRLGFDRIGVKASEKMIGTLIAYRDEILEYNKEINLTAVRDPKEFLAVHYLDSAEAATLPEFEQAETIIDVGTGGGFPGIPLAVLAPDKKFVLVDSLRKRIKIIREISEKLGITNVEFIHSRAEDLGRDKKHREKYDMAVSRAVASLPVLAEYCLPFIKIGGTLIAYKSADAEQEADGARTAIHLLGGKTDRVEDVPEAGPIDHRLIVIKKVSGTASKYPRRAGMPSKDPL